MPAALAPLVYSEALSVPPAAARYTPGREFRRAGSSASPETVLERHPRVPLPMPVSAHHGPVVTSTLGLLGKGRKVPSDGVGQLTSTASSRYSGSIPFVTWSLVASQWCCMDILASPRIWIWWSRSINQTPPPPSTHSRRLAIGPGHRYPPWISPIRGGGKYGFGKRTSRSWDCGALLTPRRKSTCLSRSPFHSTQPTNAERAPSLAPIPFPWPASRILSN
jgi:hypothetical protein